LIPAVYSLFHPEKRSVRREAYQAMHLDNA